MGDFDFNLDLSDISWTDKKSGPGFVSSALKRAPKTLARRAFSEKKLLELLSAEQLRPGESWHVISGGDIDSLSFLKYVVNQQELKYCLFSTWCMALDDVHQFAEWIDSGRIKRLDAYVGEIFPNSYSKEFAGLKDIVRQTGGRVCVFRNHAKIYAGTGTNYDFAIESSANINTNPRSENTVISIDTELFKFYKEFYDGVNSFNKEFNDWQPWGVDGK